MFLGLNLFRLHVCFILNLLHVVDILFGYVLLQIQGLGDDTSLVPHFLGDKEIIFKANLLPSADCQLQAKVCARITGFTA